MTLWSDFCSLRPSHAGLSGGCWEETRVAGRRTGTLPVAMAYQTPALCPGAAVWPAQGDFPSTVPEVTPATPSDRPKGAVMGHRCVAASSIARFSHVADKQISFSHEVKVLPLTWDDTEHRRGHDLHRTGWPGIDGFFSLPHAGPGRAQALISVGRDGGESGYTLKNARRPRPFAFVPPVQSAVPACRSETMEAQPPDWLRLNPMGRWPPVRN
ncbi:hypothetical protein AAFF_G00106660 [Aldrovandia affinis]|uniref:Uncharacterized protein n=1 Tax=Aldrovandia affinis TaxID=143900 RepID=A0AAD7WYQ3_9TELE|nr:hypothetical protein AAFF_G00106660 [Aldrovandia affinis]